MSNPRAVGARMTPPVGHPLRLRHPVLPRERRFWGAGRPSYPDEPPSRDAVEAGARAWREADVGLVVSLIEDWEVARRAPGLFEVLAREGVDPAVPHRRLRRSDGRARRSDACSTRSGAGSPGAASVLVHCNAGLGRTAVVLASILKVHGLVVDPVTGASTHLPVDGHGAARSRKPSSGALAWP